ncbi:hypothetical protein niasHS_010249 [Heterodera schachtii]|uniref:J domain-containing protein n=1 Tax=Heterodera schachtii TaxID=97005 RepID=A0ABD2J4F6_HETSC
MNSLCLLLCPRSPNRCNAINLLSFYVQKSEKNLYDLLGVKSDASQYDIKSAYFSKCKTLHPDMKCDGATKNDFLELKQAYDVLRRPAERRRYDNSLLLHVKQMDNYAKYNNGYGRGQHRSQNGGTFDGFSTHQWRSPLANDDIHFVFAIFMFGLVFVFLFYFAQWVAIRRQNKELAAMDGADELAKCFMRQRGMDASMINDPIQKERFARLLKTDIEEAMHRRNENPEKQTDPMGNREERTNDWLGAVKSVEGSRRLR